MQAALLEGLAKGLQNKKTATLSASDQSRLIKIFFESTASAVRKSALHVLKTISVQNEGQISQEIARALKVAGDRSVPEDKRADAIDFISIRNPAKYYDQLKRFFVPQEPLTVQLAALRTLSSIPDLSVSQYLVGEMAIANATGSGCNGKHLLNKQ